MGREFLSARCRLIVQSIDIILNPALDKLESLDAVISNQTIEASLFMVRGIGAV